MNREGFTLIEVLVVVAMIALLMAVLMPSLARAREQSKATVCLSNMRQLGIAVGMYASSHKGQLITYGLAHGGSVDEDRTWFNTLRREYGNVLVARCPADRSVYWKRCYSETSGRRRVSYGVNDLLTGATGDPAYDRYNQISQIKRPATTILFVEMVEEGDYATSDHVHALDWVARQEEDAREVIALDRHAGRSNYGFVDGHGKALFFEQTFKHNGRRRERGRLVYDWIHNRYDPTIGY